MYSRIFYESFSRIDYFVKPKKNSDNTDAEKAQSATGTKRSGKPKTARFFPEFLLKVGPGGSYLPLPIEKAFLWRYIRRVAICTSPKGEFYFNLPMGTPLKQAGAMGAPNTLNWSQVSNGQLHFTFTADDQLMQRTGTGGKIENFSQVQFEFVTTTSATSQTIAEELSSFIKVYAITEVGGKKAVDAESNASSVSTTTMATASKNTSDAYKSTFVRLESELEDLLRSEWCKYLAF